MFWNVGRTYFLIFCIQNIKSNHGPTFFKLFSFIFFCCVIHSFPIIKGLIFDFFSVFFQIFYDLTEFLQRIEGIYYLFLLMGFIVAYLFFCPIRRNYIWSIAIKIYFIAFAIQQMNTIKDKITTSCWCFQPNLISRKKLC